MYNLLFFVVIFNLLLINLHLIFEIIFINLIWCFWKHEWLLKVIFLIIKRRLWKFFLQIFVHIFCSVYWIYNMHMIYTFQSSAAIKGVGQYVFLILISIFLIKSEVFTALSTFALILILRCLRVFWNIAFSYLIVLLYHRRTLLFYNLWRPIPETASTIICRDWRCL